MNEFRNEIKKIVADNVLLNLFLPVRERQPRKGVDETSHGHPHDFSHAFEIAGACKPANILRLGQFLEENCGCCSGKNILMNEFV